MRISERVGERIGDVLGGVFAAVSRARGARTFHPRGDLARVSVEPVHCEDHDLKKIGWSLRGPGLIRFANALFEKNPGPDVLGCSIAFCDEKGKPEQHLLLATIQRPWTMLLAPFTTNTRDYLGNDYFGVSPFSAGNLEEIYFSLRRDESGVDEKTAANRKDLFGTEVTTHQKMMLTVSKGPRGPWTPIEKITLEEVVQEDPSLEFDPFLDGRGLKPVGFIHSLRKGVYAASRKGREAAEHFVTQPAGLR